MRRRKIDWQLPCHLLRDDEHYLEMLKRGRMRPNNVSGMSGLSGASGIFGGFSPADVTGLAAWYKSDAGLWTSSAATTASVADGDVVGRWDDQSGNARNPIQGTSSKKPLLKLAIKNGRSVVRFDGVDDFLQAVAFTGIAQPFTVFSVASCSSTGPSRTTWDMGAVGANVYLITQFTGTIFDVFAGTSDQSLGSSDANFHTLSVVFNGASSKRRVDGGSEATLAATPGANQFAQVTLGGFQTGASGNCASCDIGEVIVYSNDPSAANKTLLFNYLQSRWATY